MKWTFRETVIFTMLSICAISASASRSYKDLYKDLPPGNWFVTLGAGIQYPQIDSSTTVNNGSDFPAPNNLDIYTTQASHSGTFFVSAGRRFERESTWIPTYSFGLSYQNLFASDVGRTVTQYSLPEFTNYTYKTYLSSNILLAFAKANLFKYRMISPFINAGIGCAFNRTSDYSEAALPGVTAPRTSPAFASKTSGHVAYNLGAGIDIELNKQFIASLSYEYLDLGNVTSGRGANDWSSQALNFGTYRSNQALLSLTYLFDH